MMEMSDSVSAAPQGVAPIVENVSPAVDAPAQSSVFDPNNYSGSDIERINAALKDAGSCGGTVRIGKRRPAVQFDGGNGISTMEERDIWVIDSAMLEP